MEFQLPVGMEPRKAYMAYIGDIVNKVEWL